MSTIQIQIDLNVVKGKIREYDDIVTVNKKSKTHETVYIIPYVLEKAATFLEEIKERERENQYFSTTQRLFNNEQLSEENQQSITDYKGYIFGEGNIKNEYVKVLKKYFKSRIQTSDGNFIQITFKINTEGQVDYFLFLYLEQLFIEKLRELFNAAVESGDPLNFTFPYDDKFYGNNSQSAGYRKKKSRSKSSKKRKRLSVKRKNQRKKSRKGRKSRK